MKSGFLNIISELMERKLFLVSQSLGRLESMLRPYDVLRNCVAVLKKMTFSFKLEQSKEIEDFYPISENVRKSTINICELRLQQYKDLIVNKQSQK